MAPKAEVKNEKLPSSIYVMFIVLIIDLLGFTIILPLLPAIFDYYRHNKEDHLYHWLESKVHSFQVVFGTPAVFNNVLFGGLLGSLFSALQFLGNPIFGSLSDVHGRKPLLILSMVGNCLSYAVWCLSDYFYLFVLARVVGGISRANISLTTAVITDLCSKNNRGKGMALVGIAFSIGFIVGPMIGAAFASHADIHHGHFYFMPAVFALTISVLAVCVLLFFFEESLPKNKRATSVGRGLNEAYQFISPVSLFSFTPVQNISAEELKSLKRIGLIYFLFLFLYSGLEYSLSFLTHTRFSFTSMQQGKMYLFSGIIMIFIQGGYVRRIPPGKEIASVALGAILIIPAFIIIGISRNIQMFYVGLALYAFASATVVPCLTTIASKLGRSDQKGTVLGIFRSLGSLARALGPLVFAIAYWSLSPTISYCIGGLLLIIPLTLILKLKKNVKIA